MGLAIALLGLPITVFVFRSVAVDPTAAPSVFVREVIILALVGVLLWLVTTKEHVPLSSIGLTQGLGRSIIWGLAGMLMLGVGLAACLSLFAALGISYGSGGGAIATSKWAVLLTVIRAGIAEEVFYRGYAIERLQAITNSKWVAAVIPLIFFAAFHYRQGLPGVILALVMGAILTALYLWKRDLIANIIAHFMIDFIPNIVLPLLGGD